LSSAIAAYCCRAEAISQRTGHRVPKSLIGDRQFHYYMVWLGKQAASQAQRTWQIHRLLVAGTLIFDVCVKLIPANLPVELGSDPPRTFIARRSTRSRPAVYFIPLVSTAQLSNRRFKNGMRAVRGWIFTFIPPLVSSRSQLPLLANMGRASLKVFCWFELTTHFADRQGRTSTR
jgi:hypothetical protein